MYASRLAAPVLAALAAFVPLCASALPDRAAGRTPFTVVADSLPGAEITCTDLSTLSSFHLYGQHLLSSGEVDPEWAGGGAPVCIGSINGGAHVRIGDGAGGALVAWSGPGVDESDVFLQRFDATGAVATGWPAAGLLVCSAPGSQYQVAAATDGAGGAYVAWVDFRAGGAGEVYLQHLDGSANTAAGWPANGRPLAPSSVGQSSPCLVPDAAGGVCCFWEDRRTGASRLFGRRIASDGSANASWAHVEEPMLPAGGWEAAPVAVGDGLAGSLVAWLAPAPGGTQIRAARIDGGGALASGWPAAGAALCDAVGERRSLKLLADGADGAYAVWVDHRGNAGRVFTTHVLASGQVSAGVASTGLPISDTEAEQDAPALVRDGTGGAIVLWSDYRRGATADIYAQRLTSGLERLWTNDGFPVCRASGDQLEPRATTDAAGGAFVTWLDDRNNFASGSLRARRLTGPIPELTAQEAWVTLVRLQWTTQVGESRALRISRQLTADTWSEPQAVIADADGHYVLEDRAIHPGEDVEYRVVLLERSGEIELSPVRVTVPGREPLAIRSARYANESGAVLAAITLPTAAPSTLELFDVTGRRVGKRHLDGLEGGRHDVRFGLPQRVASGMYFLRLAQDHDLRNNKLLILK